MLERIKKCRIKKGDLVIVLTGKDKGHHGKVLSVCLQKHKIKVEGIQRVKKTIKPNPQLQKPGGIIEKEAAIHFSNVAIYNPATKKADKIKIDIQEDGKKFRVFKSSNERIEIEG